MTITYSEKTKEAIKTMHNAIETAEQARLAGKAYAGKGELLDTAKDAVKAANKAIISDGVQHFVAIIAESRERFITDYFKDWTVDGFAVVQDAADNGGAIHSDGRELRIPYSAIDAACKDKVAANGAWRKYLQIYGDNVFAFIADNDKGEHAASAKTALPAELVRKRKERGGCWLKHSHSALVQQLNDLVGMVFPEDVQPTFHMVSVDQKVITAAITKGKRTAGNEAATLQMANLNTLENILFTEIYTRMNNLAVNLDTGLKEKPSADKQQPKSGEAKGGDIDNAVPSEAGKPVPEGKTAA